VVKDSIDGLGLLRKRGLVAGVDFLRVSRAVRVQAINAETAGRPR